MNEFFKVGGSLEPDRGSYVIRAADEQLLQTLLRGDYCHILAARQTGKSSLMNRTAHCLQEQGVRTVVIDLTAVGSEQISPDQWYYGLTSEITRQLKLNIDLNQWHDAHEELSSVNRFSQFLRHVLLGQINDHIVIFIDEIDSALNLPFSDDFFAAIRALYNMRAQEPCYKRLTFALFGVARPADLIKNRLRTPYNIGSAINLTDFTLTEAGTLMPGLVAVHGQDAQKKLYQILNWTAGHPYLTQKVCQETGQTPNKEIDDLITHLFLSEAARNETNLKFIRDRVDQAPERSSMLRVYHRVHQGKKVIDEERNPAKSQLKLTGLARATSQGDLKTRNPIYHTVFDQAWIKENLSLSQGQRVAIVAIVVAIIAFVIAGYTLYREATRPDNVRAQIFSDNFLNQTDADTRLANLAGLFRLRGRAPAARDHFFEQLDAEQRLALFMDASHPTQIGVDILTVTQGLYQDPRLGDSSNANRLLARMAELLLSVERGAARGSEAEVTAREIDNWVRGRELAAKGDHEAALKAYAEAIRLSDENTAVYFDQGLSYTVVDNYPAALTAFEKVLSLEVDDSQSQEGAIQQIVIKDPRLHAYWWQQRNDYPNLRIFISTPTPSFTPTSTSSPTSAPSPTSSSIGSLIFPTFTPISQQFTLEINSSNAGQVLQLNRLGKGTINEVAYSPNGDLLAVASSLGIYLYDAETLEEILLIETDAWITRIAFSPDGETLASASKDNIVRLWRTSNGSELQTLEGHAANVIGVAFSPDGETVASGSSDGVLKLWQASNGTELQTRDDLGEAWRIAFSPDGETIAIPNTTEVKLWKGNEEAKSIRTKSLVLDIAFSPDGETLVTMGLLGRINLWRVSDGVELKELAVRYPSSSASFSPDGEILAIGSTDGPIRLQQVSSGNILLTLTGHKDRVLDIAFSPDGETLASGSVDGTIRLWRVSDGTELHTFEDHTFGIYDIAFSPDGKTLASGLSYGRARLWQADTGNELRTFTNHTGNVLSIAFSPDGTALAIGSTDGTTRLWRVSDRAYLRTFEDHYGSTYFIAFSPDGNKLVSNSYDAAARMWSVNSGADIRTFVEMSSFVYSVAFSPDGETLAFGLSDGRVSLWEVSDGVELEILAGHTGRMNSIAFSTDGEILASASSDGTIKLWQVSDGNELRTLVGHTGEVNSIAFSSDGEILVSASSDGTIKLWQVSDGNELRTLVGHTGEVNSIAFSSNGEMLASASSDGTIVLWGLVREP